MEERSLIAYENWRDAASRFDYLVLGFIGAVTAYIGQSFKPARLELAINSANAELLSLALLVGAVIAGFKRVECNVEIFRLNHSLLHSSERRSAMMRVMQEGRPGFNAQTGALISPQLAAEQHARLADVLEHGQELIDRATTSSLRFYKLRNLLFAAGFGALVVARILAAYEVGP
jgi:hypothetical protein